MRDQKRALTILVLKTCTALLSNLLHSLFVQTVIFFFFHLWPVCDFSVSACAHYLSCSSHAMLKRVLLHLPVWSLCTWGKNAIRFTWRIPSPKAWLPSSNYAICCCKAKYMAKKFCQGASETFDTGQDWRTE